MSTIKCLSYMVGVTFFVSVLLLSALKTAVSEPDDKLDGLTERRPVISYNTDSFDGAVSNQPHFVLFYAPWCGHCKRLFPIWNDLGKKYNMNEKLHGVRIAEVDCTVHQSVCAQYEVNGYPTLRYFIDGLEDSIKYKGHRTFEDLDKFIAQQLGDDKSDTSSESVPHAKQQLIEFTDKTFEEARKSGNYFVKFYAPWCGHCQRLAPVWDQLAETFEHDQSLRIAKLDCTQYKGICTEFEVKGYPTLLWIQDGQKVAKYSGDRSLSDLKRFVISQVGDNTPQETEGDGASPQTGGQQKSSSVVLLTGDNFENAIEHGTTLVMFFAPWCGHCKRLSPTYEALGIKLVGTPLVTIAKVDCTLDTNRELCAVEKIDGFPTLLLYRDGEKIAEYEGDRSLDDLFAFVSNKIGHDEL